MSSLQTIIIESAKNPNSTGYVKGKKDRHFIIDKQRTGFFTKFMIIDHTSSIRNSYAEYFTSSTVYFRQKMLKTRLSRHGLHSFFY